MLVEDAIKCRYCGATLLGKGNFCVECGKPTESEMTKCPDCGFEIWGKIKFCPDCGHAFAVQGTKDNAGIDIESDFILMPYHDYRVSKYEVTQELYEKVMGENPSHFKGERKPVENVSWYDAIVFCNRLSEKVGKKSVYSVDGKTNTEEWGYIPHKGKFEIKREIDTNEIKIKQSLSSDGYRLPTEYELRYAAKGGEKYDFAGSKDIDEVAWYNENSWGTTHDVGQKKPNGYGLYDISGNVYEMFCQLYSFDVSSYCIKDFNVYGGSWDSRAEDCRIYHRSSVLWDRMIKDIGFRLVCKA